MVYPLAEAEGMEQLPDWTVDSGAGTSVGNPAHFPFAQVVLITIKENLREEEQEENLALDKDQIKEPNVRANDNGVNLENECDPKEAWAITEMKTSAASTLTMLSMIGKVLIRFLNLNI